MEQKLRDAASALPEAKLEFEAICASVPEKQAKARPKSRRTAAAIAAGFLLLISVSLGTYVYAAEAKEYDAAVQFFDEYKLSAEGLSRGEIKSVYRDISTNAFTYSGTAGVLERSLSTHGVDGYEILQENPSPADMEQLWIAMNSVSPDWTDALPQPEGIHYQYRYDYKEDPDLGFEIHDRSYLEKYDGESLLWSVSLTEFQIFGYSTVSDGVIAYGETPTWSSTQLSPAWMAKIDANGKLLWMRKLDHGFSDEYIAAILENADGSYAVISRGELEYFCLSQYTAKGKETHFQKTEVGNYGIWDAARFGDGYIVQLGSYLSGEHARIVKVDYEGNITESFSYSGEDAYYFITDMIEFEGRIYLSAYAVPKPELEDPGFAGRREIAGILDYLFAHDIWEISSEDLTPMVRENYTAILMVCDPAAGVPQEFYSVKGSLGGALALSETGSLLWNVESIADTAYSPMTSAYTIRGSCYVFRYAFDRSGTLLSQEKTGETAEFSR